MAKKQGDDWSGVQTRLMAADDHSSRPGKFTDPPTVKLPSRDLSEARGRGSYRVMAKKSTRKGSRGSGR